MVNNFRFMQTYGFVCLSEKKTKIVGFLLNQPGVKAFHVLWENEKYLTKTPQFERFTHGPPKFEQYEQRTMIFLNPQTANSANCQNSFDYLFFFHEWLENRENAYIGDISSS